MKQQGVYRLAFMVLILTIITSGAGFFSTGTPQPYEVKNLYGEAVMLYGSGIYAHDSFFRVPIFRGTDFVMLFIACPLFLVFLLINLKWQHTVAERLLVSVTGVFLYYATSNAFGIAYNNLFLIYLALFSTSLFCFIMGWRQLEKEGLGTIEWEKFPFRSLTVFLIISGLAIFAAWLPDILSALSANRPPVLIETYTTEMTYVLDIGIIAPLSFICLYKLRKRSVTGLLLLECLLTLCIVIGIMLPLQTYFQSRAGIKLPAPVLITKVGSFCALALSALYLKWQIHKLVRPANRSLLLIKVSA